MADYSEQYNETRWESEVKKNAAGDKVIAEFFAMGWHTDVKVYFDNGWTARPVGNLTCIYCGCLVRYTYGPVHRRRCSAPVVGLDAEPGV